MSARWSWWPRARSPPSTSSSDCSGRARPAFGGRSRRGDPLTRFRQLRPVPDHAAVNWRAIGCGALAIVVFLAIGLFGMSLAFSRLEGCPDRLQWGDRAYLPAGVAGRRTELCGGVAGGDRLHLHRPHHAHGVGPARERAVTGGGRSARPDLPRLRRRQRAGVRRRRAPRPRTARTRRWWAASAKRSVMPAT